MDRRLFIAVILSIAFLFAWGALVPKFFPELARKPQQRAATSTAEAPAKTPASTASAPKPAPPAQSPAAIPAPVDAPVTPVRGERVIETVVDQPGYTARFSNRGAQLTSFVLKGYREKDHTLVDLVRKRPAGSADFPFALQSGNAAWNVAANTGLYAVRDTKQADGSRVVQFELADPQAGRIRKTFTFTKEYPFAFSIDSSRADLPYRVAIGPGIRTVEGSAKDTQFLLTGNVVVQHEGDLEVVPRLKAESLQVFEKPDYIGLEDNYFLALVRPERSGEALLRAVDIPQAATPGKKQEERKEIYVGLNAVNGAVAGTAFFGPKEADLLDKYGLENALQFGMFGFIARALLVALVFVNTFTHNYGWAIIVLTIFIKIVLYPLQHKSIVSMKKMQKVQPKVNAIKDKYKKAKSDPDQRQKMNMEMMKLYQTEGISPMAGCLPILLQLPILWAFYNLLSRAIELRGADFALWINDLSLKDPYYITPILMTVTMFIQQWITPTTMDPVQKKVFLAMPIVMGWIFKEFPSGLVLYWLVQNILSIIQQMIMNRWWKDHPESLKNA